VADAEAICEAAQRPGMHFVPVKEEAQQANAVVFRARDLLVRQRTQCINALRGHLAEYGHVVPQGPAHVDSLVALVKDPKSSVPESARGILQVLISTLNALEEQLKELEGEIARRAKTDPVARRLMTIPGIGPIAATAITALVPAPEGMPGRNRRLGEPDCQAPALAQGGIVFGPVRDPAPLFRDAVTAISIDFERHGDPGSQKGSCCYASHPCTLNRPIRATNSVQIVPPLLLTPSCGGHRADFGEKREPRETVHGNSTHANAQ
jgi:hypothetical protein